MGNLGNIVARSTWFVKIGRHEVVPVRRSAWGRVNQMECQSARRYGRGRRRPRGRGESLLGPDRLGLAFGIAGDEHAARARGGRGGTKDANPFVDLALELLGVDEPVDPERAEEMADPLADATGGDLADGRRRAARMAPSLPRSRHRRGCRPWQRGSNPCGRRATGHRPAATVIRRRSSRSGSWVTAPVRSMAQPSSRGCPLRLAISILP